MHTCEKAHFTHLFLCCLLSLLKRVDEIYLSYLCTIWALEI